MEKGYEFKRRSRNIILSKFRK
uniref:Uncharacterized protein n=1 Tax=Rhizophora mucronata TaxID=61149 RepID=A0A2P2QXT4_RHIMU